MSHLARIQSLMLAMVFCFALSIGQAERAHAQEGCVAPPVINHRPFPQDYPLPLGATGRMTFTVKGGDGGRASVQQNAPSGPYEVCGSAGGRGALITASFDIGSGQGELEPGGTLRFIVGAGGGTDVTMPLFLRVPPAAGDGGGGSAVLYRPPGVASNNCSDWRILVVAGGGGGAHQNMGLQGCSQDEQGGDASLTTDGSDGGGNNGGDGGLGLVGGGGSCGTLNSNPVSGGGGGRTAGGGSCSFAGGAGCPNGSGAGVFGFGGGGLSNTELLTAKRGGGGGGGYAGGGGGGDSEAGGGGGSYVDSDAFDVVPGLAYSGDGYILWNAPDLLVNDECVNAIPVTEGRYDGCTTTATGPIWYSFTNSGACDKEVTIGMFNDAPNVSPPDGVYRPADLIVLDECGAFDYLHFSDFSTNPNLHSEITWIVPAGVTHLIAVQTENDDRGTVRLIVDVNDVASDSLVAPTAVVDTTTGQTASGLSSCYNSVASPDMTYPYVNQSGVPEVVRATTCLQTSLDTVLSVHEACSGLQLVCTSDTCGQQSEVEWIAEPGVRYLIRVAGEGGATGQFRLDIVANPINDDCANPIPLSNFDQRSGTFATASPSGVSGGCGGPSTADMWFSYTHPDPNGCPRTLSLSKSGPIGSEFFSDCGTPRGCGANQTVVQPGESVLLRLTGTPSIFTEYAFTIDDGTKFGSTGEPPTLSSWGELPISLSRTLSDNIGGYTAACGNTTGKGTDTFSFYNKLGSRIRVKADTCGPQPTDTVLAAVLQLVTGPRMGVCAVGEVACDDNGAACGNGLQSELLFDMNPGEFVDIIATKNTFGNNVPYNITIAVDEIYPPDNDDCANAEPLSDGIKISSNAGATTDGGASSCNANTGADVWYTYTNPTDCPRLVTVDACNDGTLNKGLLTVYDSCGGSEIACDSTPSGCPTGARLTWRIEPGETHLLRYSSPDMVPGGVFQFEVSSEAIDPLGFGLPGEACSARNDLCENALQLVIDGSLPGTLANATHDVNASCADGGEQLNDVWYAYPNQGLCTAEVTITTCLFDNAGEFRSLAAYDACGGTELVCDSGSTDPNDEPCATITWDVPPGETHLVRVSGVQGQLSGDEYTLTITSIGEGDFDGDGVQDACDNCFENANAGQEDADGDGNGDACDICPGADDSLDTDNDMVPDGCDQCPGFDDALDADNDTVPDGCDQCPGFDDLLDTDGDGVADDCDPCPNDNPDDVDGNGTCGGQVVNQGTLLPGVTYLADLKPPAALPTLACSLTQSETFDFWTFEASIGDPISIEVDRLDEFPEPRLSIWQGNREGLPLANIPTWDQMIGVQLILTQTGNEPPGGGLGGGSDPSVFGFVAPFTGTYTVLVAGTCNSASDDNRYTIEFDYARSAIIRNLTRDTTHSTIQQALNSANSGDLIEIGAGYVFEDTIVWPSGKDLTLRGAGAGDTIIDAEGIDSSQPIMRMVGSGQTSATVISGMTFQKDADQSGEFGAVRLVDVSPRFEDVSFEKNFGSFQGNGAANLTVIGEDAEPVFERCRFLDARGSTASVETLAGGSITLLNCVLDQSNRTFDGGDIKSLALSGDSANVVNCTIAGTFENLAQTVNVINSALMMQPIGGGIAYTRSLFPGATGNNIDGVPSFVDEANNNFRLTPSSLGIDAADYDAYTASGGGGLDLARISRALDDPNTADTGSGSLTFLEIGAYEVFVDSDNDGVDDGLDTCPGFDDAIDADGDGQPDACDPCPNDVLDDSDNDGVCDSDDLCPGLDDSIDTDGDGTPDCAEPVGDECAYALQVGNETVTGNLSGHSGGTGDDSVCDAGDTIDAWFRYQSTIGGVLVVTTCDVGTKFDSVLSAFDGCPETGGQELSCNNDDSVAGCSLNGGSQSLSTLTIPVTIGQVVYVRLSVAGDDFFANGGSGTDYAISFLAEGEGDECDDSRAALPGANLGTMGDNTGSTGDDDSCGAFNTIDEWFTYTPSFTGPVEFNTCDPNTGFDTILSIFDGCPGNGGVELACQDGDPGGRIECELFGEALFSAVNLNVVAGQTYHIRVSASFDGTGEPNGPQYVLNVIEPDDCDQSGAIDSGELELLIGCMAGPDTSGAANCECVDFDSDGDNDLFDFAELQRIYSGP